MTPERLDYFHKQAMVAPFGMVIYGPEMLDLIAHIRDLEAQVAAARDIINEIRSEAQRTIDWNQTRGMRPATDTSMFTGSYGAAVRVARMITAAYATATPPSPEEERHRSDSLGLADYRVCVVCGEDWPCRKSGVRPKPPSPEVGA